MAEVEEDEVKAAERGVCCDVMSFVLCLSSCRIQCKPPEDCK